MAKVEEGWRKLKEEVEGEQEGGKGDVVGGRESGGG